MPHDQKCPNGRTHVKWWGSVYFRGVCVAVSLLVACAAHGGESDVLLSDGWRFAKDANEKADCSAEAFDDSTWERVRIPHDWAICGPFLKDEPTGATGRLPWKGVGWYRLKFDVPASAAGQCVFLDFDGAMAAPEVYVNGQKAGGWDYGSASFRVDATPFVRTGENMLAVRLSTLHLASRWYPGAGLYRRVTLRMRDQAHFAYGGIFVTTPEVSRERATVKVAWETEGAAKDATVTVRLVREGHVVAERTEAAVRGVLFLSVEKPDLWDVESPAFYVAEVSLADRAGKHVSRERVRFGIREIAFPVADDPNDRAANGFHLNGRRVQLKGVNLHSDLGLLGMAFDRSAARRQLRIMKEMGANAVRTSHNPPAPELLDLCDEMGILVWDECFDKWNAYGGRRDDQSLEEYVARNLVAFVKRDRNHPSVIVWSIGNEIWEWDPDHPIRKPDNPLLDRGPWGQTKVRNAFFRDQVRMVDPTRPVGIGNSPRMNAQRVLDLGIFDPLDLTGWNYFRSYVPVKEKYPHKPIIYSESASAVSSYGFYRENPLGGMSDIPRGAGAIPQVDSRDFQSTLDTIDEVFDWMENDTYCCGEFVWTGFDYLGEPCPHEKDARSSYFGIVDLTGVPKDRYWLYRSHWRTDVHTLHIAPDSWTFPGREGRKTPVVVYTDGDEAELFLNGRSLGRRRKGERIVMPPTMTNDHFKAFCRYRLAWLDVSYEPGELKAVARRDGRTIGEKTLCTAGTVAELRLSAEPSVGNDENELIWIHAETYDASGVRVPDVADVVTFSLDGPGRILGVGNGDACEHVPFTDASGHRLFGGRATSVVRREGRGEIKVRASLVSCGRSFDCEMKLLQERERQ